VSVKRIIFNMYTRNAYYYVTIIPQRGIVQFVKWLQFFWTISRNDRVTRAIFMKRPKDNVIVLLQPHERNGRISFAIINGILSNADGATTNFILFVLLYYVLFIFFLGLTFKIWNCIMCG
jgi:hypothetical protein